MATEHLGKEAAGTTRHLIKTHNVPTTTKHLAFCGAPCYQGCPSAQFKVTAPASPTGVWVRYTTAPNPERGYIQCSPQHVPVPYNDISQTITWAGGQRTGCIISKVDNTKYWIQGGSGDQLPPTGTDVRLSPDLTGVQWVFNYWDMPTESGVVKKRTADYSMCSKSVYKNSGSSSTTSGWNLSYCYWYYPTTTWTRFRSSYYNLNLSHYVNWYGGHANDWQAHILSVQWAQNNVRKFCANATTSKEVFFGVGYSGTFGKLLIKSNPAPPWPQGGNAWRSSINWSRGPYGNYTTKNPGPMGTNLSTGTFSPNTHNRFIRASQFGSWTDALGYTYSWFRAEPDCQGGSIIYWNSLMNSYDQPPYTYDYPYTP